MSEIVSERTLEEMKAYYSARAEEYDEWFYRRGRHDRGPEVNTAWFREVDEVRAALRGLQLRGDILELAPGTGIWTEQFVQGTETLTAVDASAEMIAINKAKVADERVRYVQADLFRWQPERSYDAVCFCFWLSHVPRERVDAFLKTVAKALRPGGKVFFVDSRRNQASTAVDHVLEESSAQALKRKLNDGREFEIVKNFYEPGWLVERCATNGLAVTVKTTEQFFVYGYGERTVKG